MVSNIEIFQAIPDFEGLYEISNYGKIRSLPGKRSGPGFTKQSIILQSIDQNQGYLAINLYKNPNNLKPQYKNEFLCKFLIHRLVALVFVPNPLNLPEVDHDDNIKRNNYYKNLNWVTSLQNTQKYFNSIKKS